MADIQMSGSSMGYGGAQNGNGAQAGVASQLKSGVSVGTLANVAGAVVSLALVIGVGIWGYELLMRDVTGIPVVRAAEGPMRVAPEDPGGRQADHQGLAVNEVAGLGTAAGPADQVALAPRPVGLEDEDQPIAGMTPPETSPVAKAEPAETVMTASVPPSDAETRAPVRRIMTNRVGGEQSAAQAGTASDPIQNATIQALADQIAADSARLSDPAPVTASEPEQQTQTASLSPVIDAPGVKVSLRPKRRPATLQTAAATAPTLAPTTTPAAQEIDPTALPAGTRLVQLGAYESAEIAQQEWTRISGRFDTFFDDKQRVIQRAQSGGRTFYRLRAHGFDDLADARRFCAALVAERADCIPVVVK
ncbi:SPOR domain-containing protein [Primorskyibacter aestuariivivens]|uniref:SPOR domain-containing protein n=1 Tax=Primorskyibacter aestuariivivens TaxID=1888912 RepID=UPI00230070EA|nr:SPOR domain-containing protein [Primorskyibacter aestuariivivens]MDA7428916.1 SPOR domain-containing protein [Primorskyibacter aestuariivivens]